ncbi:MAG TPA: sodium:proton antiporter [Myxococcota bacterium]|jgi:Na+/H+ antiporter NhaD/arsenite permease-like protein
MHAVPAWTLAPFAALLLSIAILPLAAPHYWESNRNKAWVSLACALPIALWLVIAHGAAGWAELGHKAMEFISFIALLGALYVISGGIYVRGSLSGTPLLNTGLLAIGALLASAIGTTGASVLLIKPLLRANRKREHKAHLVVFFIFVVSNCGGLLTPLGDPPLFLGFLKGVPFEWTFRLWPAWLLVNGALLVIFNFWDQRVFDREEREGPEALLEEVQRHEPIGIDGRRNFLFLAGVVATIFASGSGLWNGGAPWTWGIAEALMLALAAGSFVATSRALHTLNVFTWSPIVEVAVLFAGIFIAMTPALLYLNEHAARFGIASPAGFFWAAGALSSFLDNAPTYLTFAATACGLDGVPLEGRYLASYLARGGDNPAILAAISAGAVFMGANTYIGNGPNFMVKAIAEQTGVRMPSFFGYMAYSGGVLLPLFGLVTLVFFAR